MTATVAGIHNGLDTHANRPAGNAVPDGSLYSCSTHNLIYKSNLAGNSWATWGTLSGGSGAVASDTIWDAAGDLVQGTGADTAAKLTAGTAGMFLKSAGAAAVNLWAFPPGYELDYVQITSPVSITATSEATATTCITGSAVSYDGSTVVEIDWFAPYVNPDNSVAGRYMQAILYDGSSSIGELNVLGNQVAGQTMWSVLRGSRRLTPSNASHTYSIRAYVSAGTGSFGAGAAGTGNYQPAFIRVRKV